MKLYPTGLLLVREYPEEWTEEELAYWWFPQTDAFGQLIRQPRLSLQEKARYTVYEVPNLLTLAGRSQLLSYIASTTATTPPFAKIFSVGTFPVVTVSPGDTAVAGEIGRVTPGTATITGGQVVIPCSFGTNQFPGNWRNVGLYGGNAATTTLGTGILHTHALFSYQKVNGTPVVVDYLISLT